MLINNGIISIGNNNKNTINSVDYEKLIEELKILFKYTDDKKVVEDAIFYAQNRDNKKLEKTIKGFSSFTIDLIKKLSLTVILKYLEKFINL